MLKVQNKNKPVNVDLSDKPSSAVKQSNLASTIVKVKNTKDNKYLECLKHKFSPLIDLKDGAKKEVNNLTYTKQSGIKKTTKAGHNINYK